MAGADGLARFADTERTAVEALERHGCVIRGQYADCPVCGRKRKLHILRMRDGGSTWLHCFYGCETADVLDALALDFTRDLCAKRHLRLPADVPGIPCERLDALDRRHPGVAATYCAIEDYALTSPVAWPSEQTIADALGVSRRTVTRHKALLRAEGLLTWTKRRSKRTGWLYNVYTLLCTWVSPLRRSFTERAKSFAKRHAKRLTTRSSDPSETGIRGDVRNRPRSAGFRDPTTAFARAGP